MATTAALNALSLDEQSFADRMIAAYAGTPGALLSILERIQEHHPHKYLPPRFWNTLATAWIFRWRRSMGW